MLGDKPMPWATTGEVRTVDPLTGGEKGQKIERFSLIPFEFMVALARHYGEGAKKYADRNWEKGYKWSLSYDASMRHLNQWLLGERSDKETGTHHLICAIWHLIALYVYDLRKLGTDDITRLEKPTEKAKNNPPSNPQNESFNAMWKKLRELEDKNPPTTKAPVWPPKNPPYYFINPNAYEIAKDEFFK